MARFFSLSTMLFLILLQIILPLFAAERDCGIAPSRSVRDSLHHHSNLVAGGKESEARPWQVAIRNLEDGRILCSGTVIATYWVLTAARCLLGLNRANIFVQTGVHDLSAAQGQILRIDEIHRHPRFPDGNNIALLQLSNKIIYSEIVRPICLSAEMEKAVFPGATISIAGWGDTSKKFDVNGTEIKPAPAEKMSDVLMEVDLKIVSDEKCSGVFGSFGESMFCAEGGAGACSGDDGSPAIMQNADGRWFQVGIASVGAACGDPSSYGIFNRAYNYCSLIELITGEKICTSIH